MNKKEFKESMANKICKTGEQLVYVPPSYKVIRMENESFFCVSTQPNSGESDNDDWESGGNDDGGTINIGDENDVAP